MKQLRIVAVLLMLVSLASLSQVMAQPAFEVPLTITDGVTTVTQYIGVYTGADICINSADVFNTHGEGFLPPAPPGGVFDARLVSPRTLLAATCYDQGSANDFRPYNSAAQKDTFKLKSQLGTGVTMTISWPANIGTKFAAATLRYFDGSGNVNINMLTQVSEDVTLAGDPATVTIFTNGVLVPPPPAPLFAVTPGIIAFGSVLTSGTKVDSVVVSNPGAAPLNITATGSNNAAFTVLPAAPQTIPVSGSMKFYITFAPSAPGAQAGTISFTHNAAGSPGTVAVGGTGVAAPPSFEYGITVGDGTLNPTASTSLYLGLYAAANTCINAADGLIFSHGENFLPPAPPGGVFDARFISPRTLLAAICYDQGSPNDFRPFVAEGQLDTFKLKAQLGTGTTMLLGWPNNLNAQFETATLRYFDGSGNVNINMLTQFSEDVTLAGDPATVTIFTKAKTVVVGPPFFGTTPTSLAFGNVTICPTAKTDSVTVNNTGGAPLNITAISAPAQYSVLPAAPQSIPASGSMKFYVTFTAATLGAHNGNVSFTHNAAGSPGLVGVTGAGIACPPPPPCFTSTPNPLAFGAVVDSTSKLDSIVITNGDAAPMVITGVTPSDPAYSVTPTSGTIPPSGGTLKFYVTFAPLDVVPPVTHNGTLSFAFTGPSCSPGIVNVTGFSYVPGASAYTTVPPESLVQWIGNYYQRPAVRNPRVPQFPNWANLLLETVFQGGFRPGATESDTLGGMRLGISHLIQRGALNNFYPRSMRGDTAWARLSRWVPRTVNPFGYGSSQIQISLLNRLGTTFYRHDANNRGFDSTRNPGDLHRHPLRGQQSGLYPRFIKNQLFGELVALKFNIASSQLGKTPAGFGDALINMSGNPLNGLSLVAASRKIDSVMTDWKNVPQSFLDSCYSALRLINRACVGPLDTLNSLVFPPDTGSFYKNKNLIVVGVAPLPSYLISTLARPTTMVPMNLGIEATELSDPDFSNPEGIEEVPVALKLYQNYPNPFNPTTTINFHLSQAAQVNLTVYNVLGQEVATLLNNEELPDGLQSLSFDAGRLSSGVYFYIVTGQDLESGAAIPRSVGKMLLLK